jgi:RNA polymerase sigma factor (sigma-70 family)
MLRDPRDIEDAFQATFLVLVRKAPAIRDGNLLSSWLYGVAYRVARRARTQTLRRRGHEAPVAELEIAASPESAERPKIDPVLDQELNRLPEKYRVPLILCYLRGRTHDQAAAELGCPVGTVRSRLARGRDLLKKRLTRRGFAPTGAILGTSSSLPARLLVEVVPPSLVSATVKAAFGFGSTQTIQSVAIAATALALAQGVLTTMKLAQLKWIGLAVLATTLSAGGVVAVSYASPQTSPGTGVAVDVAQTGTQDPAGSRQAGSAQVEQRLKDLESRFDKLVNQFVLEHRGGGQPREVTERVLDEIANRMGANPPATPATTTPRGRFGQALIVGNLESGRFDALEQKVDQLLKRLGTNPPAATATASPFATHGGVEDPFANRPAGANLSPGRPDAFSRRSLPESTNPSRELEVQLQFALAAFDRTESLFQTGAVPINVREESRGRVRVIAAQLEGLDEDLADEIARLKLELRRKNAERVKAEAQQEMAQSVIARNNRLNERKPGMVAADDVAKAEGEMKVAAAQIGIVDVEIAEVGFRIQQLQRRQDRIKKVIALADRAKAAAPAK